MHDNRLTVHCLYFLNTNYKLDQAVNEKYVYDRKIKIFLKH
jgi:hypothetical protein